MEENTPEYERNLAKARELIENLMVTRITVDEKTGKVTKTTFPAFIKQPDGSYKENKLL